MAKRKVDSKEIGLVAGLRFMNFFLKTDYLHYGLWHNGLEVDIANLKAAQQAYSKFLAELIPSSTESILDVGCGSGRSAYELLEAGYRVDCISPSQKLTEFAEHLLGPRARLFKGRFEDVAIPDKYDLVLFSESFQYIKIEDAISRAVDHLNPNGHILVSDFFRRDDVPGRSPIGGGHSVRRFREVLTEHSMEVVLEKDITEQVAPTIDLVNAVTMEVVHPLYSDLGALLKDRFPGISKIARWKYKKKLKKIETKHFQGERSGANFSKYKQYLTLLLKPQAI